MESPFDVLGVGRDTDDEAVKEAYRRRVLETHPDRGGSAREFQRVVAAYEAVESGYSTESADGPWEPDAPEADEPPRRPSRVEYLNYEVLDDRGWTMDDDELFEKARSAGLDRADYGRFVAGPEQTLLEAAERCGFQWPYACRGGGACANCAVAVRAGDLSLPVDHVLSSEFTDGGIRLSCNGVPTTDTLQVVFNVKHRPDLDDLRLPADRFEVDCLAD